MQKLKVQLFFYFLGILSLFLAIRCTTDNQIPDCATDMDCRAPRICVKGECVNPDEEKDGGADHICQNECDTIGQKQCFGSGWKECKDHNQDGCLEYGPLQNCGPGEYCENGKCLSIKNHQGRIAFLGDRPQRLEWEEFVGYNLYVINEDGSGLTKLSHTYSLNAAQFDWSPDGKKIVFLDKEENRTDIYVVDVQDNTKVNLTKHLNSITICSPRNHPQDPYWSWCHHNIDWSPDGTKIAFDYLADYDKRDWDIYIIDLQGNLTNLTKNTSPCDENKNPMWSPDGTKIVFECKIDDNSETGYDSEIAILNTDGGGVKKITNSLHLDKEPQWSPDGKKILFESIELSIMDADGNERQQLTGIFENHNEESGYIRYYGISAWLPDGTIAILGGWWLAYKNSGDGIFVIDSQGKIIKKVVDEFQDFDHFSSSPDGKKIVLDVNDSIGPSVLEHRIYIVNSDGSGLQQLTNFVSDSPKWSP